MPPSTIPPTPFSPPPRPPSCPPPSCSCSARSTSCCARSRRLARQLLGALRRGERRRGVHRTLVEGDHAQALGLREPGARLGTDGPAARAEEVAGGAQGGLEPAEEVVELPLRAAVLLLGVPGGRQSRVERGLGVGDRAHRRERVAGAGAGGTRGLDRGAGRLRRRGDLGLVAGEPVDVGEVGGDRGDRRVDARPITASSGPARSTASSSVDTWLSASSAARAYPTAVPRWPLPTASSPRPTMVSISSRSCCAWSGLRATDASVTGG